MSANDESGESCENCLFFLKTPATEDLQRERVCRRFPPTAFIVQEGGQVMSRSVFPAVVERMWCGEWQPTEAAGTKQ